MQQLEDSILQNEELKNICDTQETFITDLQENMKIHQDVSKKQVYLCYNIFSEKILNYKKNKLTSENIFIDKKKKINNF